MTQNEHRHDVGETRPERVEREEGLVTGQRRKWRRDLVLISALLIALTTLGWWQVDRFSGDLRDSSVEGCERQNDVREALIVSLHVENVNARATDPSLFPDIPPDQFRDLIQQGINARQDAISQLQPINCEAKYP